MEHDVGDPNSLMPTDVVATRVRALRGRRGWSAQRLADAMVAEGMPWTRLVVTKLENGPRKGVTVDELLALAYILDVSPLYLMLPVESGVVDELEVFYEVTPNRAFNVSAVREWVRGAEPLPGQDKRTYFAERPLNEIGRGHGER